LDLFGVLDPVKRENPTAPTPPTPTFAPTLVQIPLGQIAEPLSFALFNNMMASIPQIHVAMTGTDALTLVDIPAHHYLETDVKH
jgi:hypothetical protein